MSINIYLIMSNTCSASFGTIYYLFLEVAGDILLEMVVVVVVVVVSL